jgi:hypothetical protein
MIIVKNDTILRVLCEACAIEFGNNGNFTLHRADIFISCYEDCEICKTRKGFYYSVKKA